MTSNIRVAHERYACDTASLAGIRARVLAAALTAGLSLDEADDVVLAVDEACANVVLHAYPTPVPPDAAIGLIFDVGDGALTVTVEDWGIPFDPGAVPKPDLDAPGRGGLGLHLMRAIADHVDYSPGDPNRLTLVKRRDTMGRCSPASRTPGSS